MDRDGKVEGMDDPEFQAPEEEAILAGLDTDLKPIPREKRLAAPDGNEEVEPQANFEPKEEDEWEKNISDIEETAEPEESEDIADETELLKQLTDGKYDSVDDLVSDYKGKNQQVEQLGELLKKAGYDVSDNPVQDLVDVLEQQMLSQAPGFLTGAQPPAQVVPPVGGATPPPVREEPRRSGEGSYYNTANFISKYPQLKWTPDFIKELTSVLSEHIGVPEAPKTDTFASRQDMNAVADLNKRLFRDQMVNEHIIERMAKGEAVPRNYRAKLLSEVDKNPAQLERAWRGYVLRGRYNGIMDDFARSIQAERDPKTGLSRAESDAVANEQRKVASNKRTVKGGSSPPAPGGKPKTPTVRDLEQALDQMGKKLL